MKPSRVKKILLGVLLIPLVYIWWGNLKLFSPSEAVYQPLSPPETRAIQHTPNPGSLVYREPKVNPFRRPNIKQTATTQPKPKVPVTPPVQRLSTSHELAGIVNSSQAVIKVSDGASVVLAVGDSLGGWELTQVLQQSVVFRHSKENDTLRLQTTID